MKTKIFTAFFTALITLVSITQTQAKETTDSIKVINKGIGGNCAINGWSRFERDVVSLEPDHLVLYFGINDACNRNIPLPEYESTMRQMIKRAQEIDVKTIVLVTPNPIVSEYVYERHPEHRETLPNMQEHLSTFAEAIRELAKEYNLPLVDLEKIVNEHGGATTEASSLLRNPANSYSRDGIHLTPEGYEIFAEMVAVQLQDIVQPGDTIVCLGDSLTYGAHVKGAGTSEGESYPAQLQILLNAPRNSGDSALSCKAICE
ncbi:SGNH/GDSL hydrolase family protein [Cerasicoccus frondis]|uniref:SGNH/GDSL hydrolase family protein n=1 Tax=Cerasicoccus frondis TaxID=490090 RepID=UPI002852CAD5|nr:GDSL-type esterase/lipase family protein [Cerasicoccus frondis]